MPKDNYFFFFFSLECLHILFIDVCMMHSWNGAIAKKFHIVHWCLDGKLKEQIFNKNGKNQLREEQKITREEVASEVRRYDLPPKFRILSIYYY